MNRAEKIMYELIERKCIEENLDPIQRLQLIINIGKVLFGVEKEVEKEKEVVSSGRPD